MSMQLFPKLKIDEENLTEYSGESNYEPYTGIILDPEDNVFKTTSGMFRDKKEFYEKLSARGYVVSKVFEKKVFDWIEENAKTTLEAYLMLSTAFSKWKGNNLLNDYYTKLLNDIPQLNRERMKGNPNTRGDFNQEKESVLEEDIVPTNIEGMEYWSTSKVTVIPVNNDSIEYSAEEKTLNPSLNQQVYDKCKVVPKGIAESMNINDFLKQIIDLRSNTSLVVSLYKDMSSGNHQVIENPVFVNQENPQESPTNFLINIESYGTLKKATNSDGKTPISNKNGGRVSFKKDDPLFVLRNKAVFTMANDIGSFGQDFKNVDAQTVNAKEINDINDQITKDLILNSNDPEIEKAIDELIDTAETLKNRLSDLLQNNPKYLLTSNNVKKLGPDAEELKQEYETAKRDKIGVSTGYFDKEKTEKVTPTDLKLLAIKYNAKDNQSMIHGIAKREKEILNKVTELAKSIIPSTNECISNTKRSIDDLVSLISNKYSAAGSNVLDRCSEISDLKLQLEFQKTKLKKLLAKKANQQKSKSLPITGWSSGGYKAAYTTTQDDLNVGKGIHNLTKEESVEEIIPIVDDMPPGKHVNYNANLDYIDYPTYGAISSPGAFNTGGTFMTEQDEHWGWVHEKLNQELFEGTKLRPEVREALLRIAEKFETSLGLSIKPVDVYFTGSSANFNYNDSSDIDLHLVYDFEQPCQLL